MGAEYRENHERTAKIVALLRPMLRGQPVPYSWPKQNYNAGWDQAVHHMARTLTGRAADEASPLEEEA